MLSSRASSPGLIVRGASCLTFVSMLSVNFRILSLFFRMSEIDLLADAKFLS